MSAALADLPRIAAGVSEAIVRMADESGRASIARALAPHPASGPAGHALTTARLDLTGTTSGTSSGGETLRIRGVLQSSPLDEPLRLASAKPILTSTEVPAGFAVLAGSLFVTLPAGTLRFDPFMATAGLRLFELNDGAFLNRLHNIRPQNRAWAALMQFIEAVADWQLGRTASVVRPLEPARGAPVVARADRSSIGIALDTWQAIAETSARPHVSPPTGEDRHPWIGHFSRFVLEDFEADIGPSGEGPDGPQLTLRVSPADSATVATIVLRPGALFVTAGQSLEWEKALLGDGSFLGDAARPLDIGPAEVPARLRGATRRLASALPSGSQPAYLMGWKLGVDDWLLTRVKLQDAGTSSIRYERPKRSTTNHDIDDLTNLAWAMGTTLTSLLGALP